MQALLTLFGPMELIYAGTPVTFATNSARALVAYLALHAGRPFQREALATLLWPDHPQAAAYTNLRQTLSRIHKALREASGAPTLLEVSRRSVRFNGGSLSIDVARFEALLTASSEHPHANLLGCTECIERLEHAVALYRGDLLMDLFLPQSEVLQEWLLVRREELRRQALNALHSLTVAADAVGDYAQMQQYAARQLALEPWHEVAHVQMMRALAGSGQRAAALAQYATCRQVLQAEFGIEPEAETSALCERIRAGELSPARPAVLALRHNLPASLTPFVGRERELAELAERLQRPEVRLLTLVGAGGMGKTRLALEVARAQQRAYTHGVVFVPLASLAAAASIPGAVGAALGLAGVDDPMLALTRFLRGKRMLLVLDNFEHLSNGAGLVVTLLETAPDLQVLVTSRERLRVRGEHMYCVEGLAYAHNVPLHVAMELPAVRLLIQCARQARPRFELTADNATAVHHICRLVGGMPLGLELASARLETLEPQQIADAIECSADFLAADWRDVAERHKSIRAVWEWSWRLLGAAEQQAFRRLAVFRGGFTGTAAEHVTQASPAVLARLVHTSLLRRVEDTAAGTVRYEIHELLRQYAEQELDRRAGERTSVEARHSTFYAAFVAAREQRLARDEPRRAAVELGVESDNIVRAWLWATGAGTLQALDESAVGLWLYHWVTGLSAQGEWLFGQAVARLASEQQADQRQLGYLLSKLQSLHAFMLIHVGRYDEAAAAAQRAIRLGQGDVCVEGETMAHFVWGEALYRTGRREAARERMADAVELARRYQQRYPALEVLHDVEWHAHVWWRGIELSLGDYAAAREHGRQALAICRRLGKILGEVHCLCNLGDVAREVRDLPTARRDYEAALRLLPAVGYRWGEGVIQLELGDVVRLQGDYGLARTLLLRALAVFREIGEYVEEAYAVAVLGRLYMYLGDYAAAREWLTQFLRVIDQVESPEVRVDGLLPLALLALHIGDDVAALQYAEQGWQLAREYSSRYTRTHAHTILAHAHRAGGRHRQAAACYRAALADYQELGNAALAAEARAGLAQLALMQGDRTRALAHVEAIWPQLAGETYVGIDEPFFVYHVCYDVLHAVGDERAATVLQAACTLLQTYADHITDGALRRSFIENVAVHRALRRAADSTAAPTTLRERMVQQPDVAAPAPTEEVQVSGPPA